MASTRNIDYPKLTRAGFALGVALFVLGLLGHLLGPTLLASAPAWVFTDLEIIGVLIGLLAPITFGIVLPLTE